MIRDNIRNPETGKWTTVDREPTAEEQAQIDTDLLEGAASQAKSTVYNGFNAALNGQITYNGAQFDNRVDSRADLNGVLTNVLNGVTLPTGFAWRDANNVDHPFVVDDLKALAELMLSNQWAAHAQKRALLAQWEAAETVEEYEAIQWS